MVCVGNIPKTMNRIASVVMLIGGNGVSLPKQLTNSDENGLVLTMSWMMIGWWLYSYLAWVCCIGYVIWIIKEDRTPC